MHFDGSKTIHGLGVGIVLTSPKNDQLRYVLQIHFAASNNVAEYEALVHGLKVAKDIGICRIMCFRDSDLVIQQCSGIWDAHDANMVSYHFLVQQISAYFEGCEFRHVPQAQNDAADTLSKLGSSRESIPPGISLEHLRKPSIKPSSESMSIYVPPSPEEAVPMEIDAGASADNPGTLSNVPGTGPTFAVTAVFWNRVKGKGKMYQEVVPVYPGTALAYPGTDLSVPGTSQPMEIDYVSVEVMEIDQTVFTAREVPSWACLIMDFMVNGQLLPDEAEARCIMRRSKAYTIINKDIYKRSTTRVLQRCVESSEGQEMLQEIHQGECGHHASSRALVSKAFRHGFYWPTALQEAEDLVWKCNGCQSYGHQIHQPASALKTIPLTWPFVVWGLDMVGAFKPARGKMTLILVMVDKFTKWIEVKPISKCDGHIAVKFLTDIILRYGVPHSIITDNGLNFAQGPFARYCEEVGI
jgi:ribonuclease HI